jgi:His-Xaa-Ser system radical SAM maturase HxsB
VRAQERRPAFFRFRRSPRGDSVLCTNDVGDHVRLSPSEFALFAAGKMDRAQGTAYTTLAEHGFFRRTFDAERTALRYRQRNEHLFRGPNLHIVVTTLRCNELCLYCHASRTNMDHGGVDMSLATARQVVDTIFQAPSPSLNIEFQGGEPTANWPTLQFIVRYAKEKNRLEGRDLALTLVTNLSLMTDERMRWLVDEGVAICTSLDGPRELHDWNRRLAGGSAFDQTVSWMDKFHAEYAARGMDPVFAHVDALMTTTRMTLGRARDLVDEYVARGIKVIHLRPLNPFGFAVDLWTKIGYAVDEYLAFWREALDYILEINRQGTLLIERGSALLLTRILSDEDPNYVDLRSPSGSGLATLAYYHDGSVYTCDEGRMLAKMGDDLFKLGHVATDSYADLMGSAPVRACAAASVLDAVPACSTCAYNPYCGVRPVNNYALQKSLTHQAPTNAHCQHQLGVFDRLFELLQIPENQGIFAAWTVNRPRVGGLATEAAGEDHGN